MFMQHGLMLATFMCGAGLTGAWLWWNKALPARYFGAPTGLYVIGLLIVGVACKSTGAVILLVIGLMMLFLARYTRKAIILYLMAILPMGYIVARSVGGWDGSDAVDLAFRYLSETNGGSLQMRFDNENHIIARTMTRPTFGWGNGSEFLDNDEGGTLSVPDGLWVIALGTTGVVGLVSLFLAMIVPAVALIWRYPPRLWTHPAMAAPGVLAVLLISYAADCLMNAMINPVYIVTMGAMAAVAVAKRTSPRPVAAAAKPSFGMAALRPQQQGRS